MAATNQSLARSNKSRRAVPATNGQGDSAAHVPPPRRATKFGETRGSGPAASSVGASMHRADIVYVH
jgi:hypothetical protein